jgi:hypothetical protein
VPGKVELFQQGCGNERCHQRHQYQHREDGLGDYYNVHSLGGGIGLKLLYSSAPSVIGSILTAHTGLLTAGLVPA